MKSYDEVGIVSGDLYRVVLEHEDTFDGYGHGATVTIHGHGSDKRYLINFKRLIQYACTVI